MAVTSSFQEQVSARLPSQDRAADMLARRPYSAWLMSMIVHAALFVLFAISWKVMPRNANLEPERSVDIVLVHQQEGRREYLDPTADQADDRAQSSAISQALPTDEDIPVDLSKLLPGAAELTTNSLADSILDATQLTGEGTPRRGGVKNGTSTEVFGITGEGTRFVYVFDRSGSMENFGGRPLQAAKIELLESLDDLDSTHQFQIIFYNEHPNIFQPDSRRAALLWGDAGNKGLARQFVDRIKANGGTEHLAALELALGMHPDVIFFLTDADQPKLTFGELQRVRRWNRGTTIHTIEFGAGPRFSKDNFLVKLAHQNGGQHAYVDVRLLGKDQ